MKEKKIYAPMSESTVYKDLKAAYDKIDIQPFTVNIRYDRWWHRFIPKKRKEMKQMKSLTEFMINQKETTEKILDNMKDKMLYGYPAEFDKYEGKSILRLAKKENK